MATAVRQKRATVRDVALAAAVSTTAVSRWLNGSILLPPKTVERIERAIKLLHYEPNLHARRLSLGRTDTLALVVPDIADPFFAALAGSVEAAAEAHGLGLVLCATLNRIERELDYLNRLRRNHVDGLLFATNHPDDGRLRAAVEGQSSVVLLDEDVAGTDLSKIFCDNLGGAFAATRLLVAAGHRRIGFIGGATGVMSAVERAAGHRNALGAAGIAPDTALEHFGAYSAAHGRHATHELLNLAHPPTALFASSDQIAIGALDVLRERGLPVPQAMSLVAYDDVAPFHHFAPPLTAIRQPVADMGRRGVDALVAHLSEPERPATAERLPVELMQRGSVAAPAREAYRSGQRQPGA